MNLNLSNFKPKDLNGQEYPVPDLSKTLGNALYLECQTIEQEDLARAIHKGEEFEISEESLDLLISFLEQKTIIRRWIQSQVLDHLKSLKKEKENLEVSE